MHIAVANEKRSTLVGEESEFWFVNYTELVLHLIGEFKQIQGGKGVLSWRQSMKNHQHVNVKERRRLKEQTSGNCCSVAKLCRTL